MYISHWISVSPLLRYILSHWTQARKFSGLFVLFMHLIRQISWGVILPRNLKSIFKLSVLFLLNRGGENLYVLYLWIFLWYRVNQVWGIFVLNFWWNFAPQPAIWKFLFCIIGQNFEVLQMTSNLAWIWSIEYRIEYRLKIRQIGQFALFWAYNADNGRIVNPIELIFSPLVL